MDKKLGEASKKWFNRHCSNRLCCGLLRSCPNYKLVKHWLAERSGDGPDSKYRGDKTLELYDLSRDIEESNDLSEKMPELTNALHRELMAFLNQANAETEYTNRWDAFSRMKKQQGVDFKKAQTIEPRYTSPFGRK